MIKQLALRLPLPTTKQAEIEQSTAKRKVIVCGRRFGKTTLYAKVACETLIKGKRVFEYAPVAKQTSAFWRKCKHYLRPLIDAGYIYKNETDRILQLKDGFIQAQTAYDATTMRGDWCNLLLLDEFSYMREDAWSEAGAPMLLDADGDAWFAFTPNRRNHAFGLYAKAIGDMTGEYAAFHATSYDNPYLSEPALARLTADMTEDMIKQEIMAEFLENEGAVFHNLGACMNAKQTKPEEHKGHVMVAGLDYAKIQDYTVLTIACATCKAEVYMDRFNEIDYVYQNQRVTAALKKWDVKQVWADSASIGEASIDYLRHDNIPIIGYPTNSHTKKNAIIDALSFAFENMLMQFLPDKVARAELEAYEGTVTKSGLITYNAPEGLHDDTVIARALMWHAVRHAPAAESKPQPNPMAGLSFSGRK